MKHDELDSVINALRPAMVDELSDAAYERRPDAALVRARADTSAPGPSLVRRRRPARRVALATGAVAVVTATAVLATGALSDGHQGTRIGGTGRNEATNTRAFLLASAETAAKQPATHGSCWYSRTRMWLDLMPFPAKSGTGARVPADKGHQRTFHSRTAASSENWACTLPGGTGMRFRSHGPLDVQITFPTEKDKAAWRAAGSPPLMTNIGTTASRPLTATYDGRSHLVNPDIGSHEIEWKTIAKLPATKSGLESYLRKLWQEDRKGGAHGYVAPADFGLYVFESAADLFITPITPGTRAALYRILADFPSVRVTGQIKDREGRLGTAITAQTPDGVIERLVIDPATAQLLDDEHRPGGPAGAPGAHSVTDYRAVERQGWVNRIGAIPAP
ncbi:hypothetical protein [Actinoallomurus acaciae]|uniref:Uncharacterized protein n=1 Tax=Actinoallomurus acaciae TaxID=502577 RepID=A0ABV5YI57_9ACTN